MNILVGGAWPYANGSLHLGHLASLLPGDVIARYHRQCGDNVMYVSGSDCHGTPIMLRAKAEKVSPSNITDKYHKEFTRCFEALGFSFDKFYRTDDDFHKSQVQKIIKKFYENGYLEEKIVKQLYCPECKMALADRFVEGECPNCGKKARGDQCDHCGSLLNPLDLVNKHCKICGKEPVIQEEKQLFFKLSAFQKRLEDYLITRKNWRKNSIGMTQRYLKEGLVDRALSRDLSWGIDVPIQGYENKKVYVWFDAVLGYLTASMKRAEEIGESYDKFWKAADAKSYYVHGKDNIPFHSIIFPAQLMAAFEDFLLPTQLVSSEYLTLEGRKISTSENWAVWLPDIIDKYNPDSIRYFLLVNGPENKDMDFSWREFVNCNNGELLGAYGNLVNRTLVFAHKNFDGNIPSEDQGAKVDQKIEDNLRLLFDKVSDRILKAEFRDALELIFESIRSMNKYFDGEQPWLTVKSDRVACANTIYNCINAIKSFAILLKPFVPFSSEKVLHWIGEKDKWEYNKVTTGQKIEAVSILFERLDKKIIDEEVEALKKNNIRK